MDFREDLEADLAKNGGGWIDFVWSSDNVEEISDEIVDQDRWATYHEMIIKYGDRYYKINYDRGSTEYQESSGEYTITEVKPVEVTVTKYVKV